MTASCDTCRAPGNCCKGFVLNIGSLPADSWREEAQALMAEHGLPFVPVSVSIRNPPKEDGSIGVVFDCPLLGSDGRCTDYINRPLTCHAYQPGDDALCAEWVPSLKGIPINVVHAAL